MPSSAKNSTRRRSNIDHAVLRRQDNQPDSAYVSMGYRTQNPDGSFTTANRSCGGFHPDYCIEWVVNRKKYYMQVCFGCCMVKIFGPEGALRCDIDSSDKGPLGKVLRHYHNNRPARSSR